MELFINQTLGDFEIWMGRFSGDQLIELIGDPFEFVKKLKRSLGVDYTILMQHHETVDPTFEISGINGAGLVIVRGNMNQPNQEMAGGIGSMNDLLPGVESYDYLEDNGHVVVHVHAIGSSKIQSFIKSGDFRAIRRAEAELFRALIYNRALLEKRMSLMPRVRSNAPDRRPVAPDEGFTIVLPQDLVMICDGPSAKGCMKVGGISTFADSRTTWTMQNFVTKGNSMGIGCLEQILGWLRPSKRS